MKCWDPFMMCCSIIGFGVYKSWQQVTTKISQNQLPFFLENTSMSSKQLSIAHPGKKDQWMQILFMGMLLNDGLIERHSRISYAPKGF